MRRLRITFTSSFMFPLKNTKISKLEAYAILESYVLIQLVFCIRYSLKPEWDLDKLGLLKSGLQLPSSHWLDRIISGALYDIQRDPSALQKAIAKLPAQHHEGVFLACARIVSLKGFEEDITQLVTLKESLAIEDYRAEMFIELASREAELIRMSLVL